jgi:hypothetical protein
MSKMSKVEAREHVLQKKPKQGWSLRLVQGMREQGDQQVPQEANGREKKAKGPKLKRPS